MKHSMKITTILTGLLILIIAGCKKDSTSSTPQPNDNNSPEKSISIGDQAFDGINGLSFSYFSANGLKAASLNCPLVTAVLNGSFPLVITLDWGAGCTSTDDGITRSGKATISLSGMMNVANSAATFTFDNFVSNGNKITGTHKITYMGGNPGNNWPRYAVLTDAKIEFPDKTFINYHAEYIRLLSEGSSTMPWTDDVWRIEGASSGTTRTGVQWTANYPSAVVKKMACHWFSSGTIAITPDGGLTRTIDFGDGTCDDKATVTIGGVTTNIVL